MSQEPITHFKRFSAAPLPLLVLILLANPAVATGLEKSKSTLRKLQPHGGLGLVPADVPSKARDDSVGFLDLKLAGVAAGQGSGHSVERRDASVKQGVDHASQLHERHGSRGTLTWWVLGALVVCIPILITAGCMSLSNQMDSPGMVASCVAVVFGTMSNRRPSSGRSSEGAQSWRKPPNGASAETTEGGNPGGPKSYGGWRRPGPWGLWQTKDAEQRPASTNDGRVPSKVPTQTMPGQATGPGSARETTQYRQWEDPRHAASTNPRVYIPQEAAHKRVHFMGAPHFSGGDSTASVAAGSEPTPTFPAPGAPLGTPQDVPVYCEPKSVLSVAGSEKSIPEVGASTAQRCDY